MSNTGKIVVGIIIVVVLGGLAFAYFRSPNTPVLNPDLTATSTPSEATTTPEQVGPGDTSDSAIDQDLVDLDAQVTNLGTDSANVDASVNNQ